MPAPDDSRRGELLACPRCDKSPLDESSGELRCGACRTRFPAVGDIPFMFAHPEASMAEWRNRLHFELERLAREASQLEAELAVTDLCPLTRRRLELQREASTAHRQSLQQLLAPIGLAALEGNYESHLALRTRLPRDQGLYSYYANVHRDWAWGDDENRASLDEVLKVSNTPQPPGNLLVLGAGACRLAYDLHMRRDTPGRTVALDFNPLLMLIARRVMNGEPLELYEFPLAPRTLDDFAVRRRLTAPEPVREGFYQVLGDALRPPFPAGAFDTVVTPWLIDIIVEDLDVFAARVNRLLRAGGRWINFGSLAFEHPRFARRYSAGETAEIVGRHGFADLRTSEATIPYMCSPASRHGRQERAFSFAAVKSTETAAPPRHKALPDWLVTGAEPVPLTPAFRSQALSTQIYSFVMSLIDGRRSIDDMATLLEQQKLMSKQEAVPAIRNFLTRMHDDSERQP